MLERSGMTRDVLDRARRSRDARFDGKFFIAVTSTKIYCRSICPAKVSKDCNVRYYATAAEAAAAGFRPCRRCRPEAAPGSPAWLGTSAVVRRALRMIQEGALDHSSVERLAERLGVGARHLGRLFTRHVGASPVAIAQTRRLHFAKQLLDETRLPITEIALASGFGSVRRFNDTFKAAYRRSPREIRRVGTPRRRRDAEIALRLTYRPPYDWPQVSRTLAARAIHGVESVEPGVYRRTVRTSGGHAVIEVRCIAGADALELRIRGGQSSDLLTFASAVRRMFDLSADPARISEVLQRDPALQARVVMRRGLRLAGIWDPFECAVRLIVGHGHSPATTRLLLARLVRCAGQRVAEDAEDLQWLFPHAAALAGADLAGIGLSGETGETLCALAQSLRDLDNGTHHFGEAVLEAVHRLGRPAGASEECLSLFGLGEPDALPCDDDTLRQQLSLGDTPLTRAELEARAELWRPFRGYAAILIWNAAAADPDVPAITAQAVGRFQQRPAQMRKA